MKRSVAALALVTVLFASAPSLLTAGANAARHDARIVGAIRLCGGPHPGRCFSQGGTVLVLDSQHHVLASQQTKTGRFSFVLSPGRYTLEAKTGNTGGTRAVVARANKTTKANIIVNIR